MLVKKKSRKFVLKKEYNVNPILSLKNVRKKVAPSVEYTGNPRSKIMDDASTDGLKRPESYDKPTGN